MTQHGSGQVIQHALEDARIGAIEGVRRYFDLEVRAEGIDLDVVVLDQQDQTHFSVLQAVLIARVATDTALGPFVAGELDQSTERSNSAITSGRNLPLLQLPHRVHAATQNAHA